MVSKETEKSRLNEWYDDRNKRLYSYIYRGLYAEHLSRWYKYFEKKQILVQESELFYKDPYLCLDQITNFLELKRYSFNCEKQHNSGEYSDRIGDSDMKFLQKHFYHENEKLFNLLGRRLWNTPLDVSR